ncbi:hypothetical protein GCM10010302_46020 [Streptomyces polychromogenes]|uniref:Uncharacterized protein n=1 Tax=Streptomyces polychromogenes TaxID=67342 RepID=A0ABP3F7Q3_9ACTN
MSEPVEAAEFAFELGWRLRGLEAALGGGGWRRGGAGLAVRVRRDEAGGTWTAVGDDGRRRVTRVAGSADEATAQVQEAFGVEGWRPQPPPPPGWQRFTLLHRPAGECPPYEDPRYDRLRARPPRGCVAEPVGGGFGLRCERPGARLLDAVAATCAEVREGYGLLLCDLGVEKVQEWVEDGPDGWGAEIVGQLLLMVAERGPRLGYSVEDLAGFLRMAAGGAVPADPGRE